mgnify:CR=1 FL=1
MTAALPHHLVWLRQDPPFDMEYIYSTYVLDRAALQGALIVNQPQGLRDMNEKVYTAWFPQCCAPTLITRDMADMHAFLREHGRAVCKPLYGMGGRSIFVVDAGDKNANVIFETLTEYGTRYAIVQRYIPDIVTTGDSRVILVDGEPVPYALARIPTDADNRGNLAAGARGVGRPLNPPMPWFNVRAMADEDLRAMYAFVKASGTAGRPAPAVVTRRRPRRCSSARPARPSTPSR